MEVTQILMKEHEIIKSVIRDSVDKVQSSQKLTINEFNYYYDFFTQYADSLHHKKEEDIYFNWLLEKDLSLKHGPVGVMLHDHEIMRKVIREAKKFLELGNYDEFKNAYMQFCDSLYNHIYKEDNILYKIAEKLDSKSHDGDDLMLHNFHKVQKQEEATLSKWSNYPIHVEVMAESEQLRANKGQCGGCCGMC